MSTSASNPATTATSPTRTVLVGSGDADGLLRAVIDAFAVRLGAGVVSTPDPAGGNGDTRDAVPCTRAGLEVADRRSGPLAQPGCSVLVVGPHCSGELVLDGPVVVPFDGSNRSTSVFSIARSWAHRLDVPIVLTHMWDPRDSLDQDTDIFRGVRDALAMLGPSAHFEPVRTSYPAGAIRGLARELDASFVAMSSLGSAPYHDVVIGHVAARVVREASCPVLLRRPVDDPH